MYRSRRNSINFCYFCFKLIDQAQQNHSVAEAKHGDADARAKEADRASIEISSRSRGAGELVGRGPSGSHAMPVL